MKKQNVMTRRRWIIVGSVSGLLFVFTISLWTSSDARAAGPGGAAGAGGGKGALTVATTLPHSGHANASVSLSGTVVPATNVDLGFGSTGTIQQVFVHSGQTVQAGTPIAILDTTPPAQAAAAAAVARANLAKAEATARAAGQQVTDAKLLYNDRTSAQQQLAGAQSQANQAAAAVTVAQANLQSAQAKLTAAHSNQATSSASVLPQVIQADQQQLSVAQQQLTADQQAEHNAQRTLSAAQSQQQATQSADGSLAQKYAAYQQAYQAVLTNYDSWQGYGTNPYTSSFQQAQAAATASQQAVSAVNSAAQQVSAAQADLSKAQDQVSVDDQAISKVQSEIAQAQNELESVSAQNTSGVQEAQAGVAAAQASVTSAKTTSQDAHKSLLLAQASYNDRTAAQVQVDQAQSALAEAQAGIPLAQAQLTQAQTTTDTLSAPVTGVIASVPAQVGSVASTSTTVAVLQGSKMTVQVPLNASDIGQIRAGQLAQIQGPPGSSPMTGTVTTIQPSTSGSSSGDTAIVVLRSFPTQLVAGQSVSVTITTASSRQGLFIPSSAVVYPNGYPDVFVAVNGKAVLKRVSLGLSSGSQIQILSGLTSYSEVITTGQTYLAPGDAVLVPPPTGGSSHS